MLDMYSFSGFIRSCISKEIHEWCLVAEDIILLALKIIYTQFIVSESIYMEKGIWGLCPPDANDIWKYQIKWNHFHYMDPEYFVSLFLRPYYVLVPLLSHFKIFF